MKLKIRINPIVLKDIEDAKEYIKEENNYAISKFSKRITDSIDSLSEFPELGIELAKRIAVKTNYRYLIVDEYIIFYKFDENNLFVYRILNAKRDYMKILFEWS